MIVISQSLAMPERTLLCRVEELSETVIRMPQCGWRALIGSLIAMKRRSHDSTDPGVTLSCLHVGVVQDEASRRLRRREGHQRPEASDAVLDTEVTEAEITKVMATEVAFGVQILIHNDGDGDGK